MDSDYKDYGKAFSGFPDQDLGFPEVYFGSTCKLTHVYRGRFCFDFGLAASCSPSTITITRGTEYSLSIEVSGISAGITHTQETEVTFTITECDSVRPVLCFENSTLYTYDCDHWLGPIHWSSKQSVFNPGSRPKLHGNCIKNDPECGCDKRTAMAPENARNELPGGEPAVTKVLTPGAFVRIPAGGQGDVGELATAAIEDFVAAGDGDEAGVVRADGRIHWLTGGLDKHREEILVTVLSAGSGGGVLVNNGGTLPIFAVSRLTPNMRCQVRLQTADSTPAGTITKAEVRHGRVTTIFADTPVKLPRGTVGQAVIEMDDGHGRFRAVAREPFKVT